MDVPPTQSFATPKIIFENCAPSSTALAFLAFFSSLLLLQPFYICHPSAQREDPLLPFLLLLLLLLLRCLLPLLLSVPVVILSAAKNPRICICICICICCCCCCCLCCCGSVFVVILSAAKNPCICLLPCCCPFLPVILQRSEKTNQIIFCDFSPKIACQVPKPLNQLKIDGIALAYELDPNRYN